MCYPPVASIRPGMTIPADYLHRIGYRLPTDAEWEYACRGGTVTSRPYGNDKALLDYYAWTRGNANETARPVGLLKPNALGLFDTLGNVWEWCQDREGLLSETLGKKTVDDTEDSGLVIDDKRRVRRGGDWGALAWVVRSASRARGGPRDRYFSIGFRTARTVRP